VRARTRTRAQRSAQSQGTLQHALRRVPTAGPTAVAVDQRRAQRHLRIDLPLLDERALPHRADKILGPAGRTVMLTAPWIIPLHAEPHLMGAAAGVGIGGAQRERPAAGRDAAAAGAAGTLGAPMVGAEEVAAAKVVAVHEKAGAEGRVHAPCGDPDRSPARRTAPWRARLRCRHGRPHGKMRGWLPPPPPPPPPPPLRCRRRCSCRRPAAQAQAQVPTCSLARVEQWRGRAPRRTGPCCYSGCCYRWLGLFSGT
jgi:hypothetical protein